MKHMKKIAALGLTAVMSLSLLSACSSGTDSTGTADSPAPADESTAPAGESTAPAGEEAASFTTVEDGKLTMATNAQFPPYELVSDGEGYEGTGFEGIDVELAYALAQKLGLELQIDDMDFDGALVAVQNGKCDVVLAGLTYNEERDLVMDFTDTYANGVQVVIVPEDSDITTLDDLAGKKIGTQRGTTGYIYTSDEFGDDAVSAYDDGATAVQALMNGQVDCVVIDNAPAQEYVKANEGLKILDTEYANEDYCIAVDEGNTALLDALNTALDELQADGTVQAILDKYIQE
ncbi:ABC transporter substrate-binding protein [Flavonifractor hominis]|uniref:ABC transporter substrate-binding protein n=1 Tax=Flavonifractor hominis TaxID=3133178 RepID=A0ABV1ET54_9FIRM